jgi:hypothetical protein
MTLSGCLPGGRAGEMESGVLEIQIVLCRQFVPVPIKIPLECLPNLRANMDIIKE